jgi:RNA polymerase sigma-70 factor (ECF subfamily)
MSRSALASRFLNALPALSRARFEALGDLEERLLGAISSATADGFVAPKDFAVAMAERVPLDVTEASSVFESFHPRDLALALGCARGDARALAMFEREHGAEIDRAIKKSPTLGLSTDEFRQLIRDKLFVAEQAGKDPRIASYGGRAPLSSWVRVTCARAVVDLARRKNDRERPAEAELLERLPDQNDPEVRVLRERYGSVLPQAFAVAVAALTPRQRNLLRQRYVHETSANALAQSYGVHRATMFGWIEESRTELLRHMRAALKTQVQGPTLDSVLHLMGSELAISIRRMLDSRIEDEPPKAGG